MSPKNNKVVRSCPSPRVKQRVSRSLAQMLLTAWRSNVPSLQKRKGTHAVICIRSQRRQRSKWVFIRQNQSTRSKRLRCNTTRTYRSPQFSASTHAPSSLRSPSASKPRESSCLMSSLILMTLANCSGSRLSPLSFFSRSSLACRSFFFRFRACFSFSASGSRFGPASFSFGLQLPFSWPAFFSVTLGCCAVPRPSFRVGASPFKSAWTSSSAALARFLASLLLAFLLLDGLMSSCSALLLLVRQLLPL